MPETVQVEEVQVSALRDHLRERLSAGKPLIVRKNSSVLGILLCVKRERWYAVEHPRREKSRLHLELDGALAQLLR